MLLASSVGDLLESKRAYLDFSLIFLRLRFNLRIRFFRH